MPDILADAKALLAEYDGGVERNDAVGEVAWQLRDAPALETLLRGLVKEVETLRGIAKVLYYRENIEELLKLAPKAPWPARTLEPSETPDA